MDTFKQIRSLIETKARRGDVVIGIGDANSRLQRSVKGYTGRYCAHPSAHSGGAILHELMVDHKLLAVSTYFKPPRRSKHGSATYLQKNLEYGALHIDYALVSRRWLSSVQNCAVKWGPYIHRFGYKYDHGMVQLTWKFRVKFKIRREPPIDLSRLKDPVIKQDYDAAVITEIAEASIGTSVRSQNVRDRKSVV